MSRAPCVRHRLMAHDGAMSSSDLFGGPKRLLVVIAVIVVVAVMAALATLLVRHALGPPEGPSPYESTESAGSRTAYDVRYLVLASSSRIIRA